jgi:hypothetical protein
MFSDPQAGASYFHWIFVTGNTYDVGVGGFVGTTARDFADYECTFAAWDGGMIPDWDGVERVFTAVLSHRNLPTPNARDRFDIQGRLVNTRNEIVWNNADDFIVAIHDAPWTYTEFSGPVLGSNVLWSGSDVSAMLTNDCNGWTSSNASGEHGSRDLLQFGGLAAGCSGGGHFICIGPAEIGEFAFNTVTDSYVYHRNSVFDTGDITLALDTNKSLARGGNNPEPLGFDNLINSSRGINGLVFDFDNLPGTNGTVVLA